MRPAEAFSIVTHKLACSGRKITTPKKRKKDNNTGGSGEGEQRYTQRELTGCFFRKCTAMLSLMHFCRVEREGKKDRRQLGFLAEGLGEGGAIDLESEFGHLSLGAKSFFIPPAFAKSYVIFLLVVYYDLLYYHCIYNDGCPLQIISLSTLRFRTAFMSKAMGVRAERERERVPEADADGKTWKGEKLEYMD